MSKRTYPETGFVRVRRVFWDPDKKLQAEFPVSVIEKIQWAYLAPSWDHDAARYVLTAVIRCTSLPPDLLARWDWGRGRSGFIKVYIVKQDNNRETYAELARIADRE